MAFREKPLDDRHHDKDHEVDDSVADLGFLHGDGLWPLKDESLKNSQAVVTVDSGKKVLVTDYMALIDGVQVSGAKPWRKLKTNPVHRYEIQATGPTIVCLAIKPKREDREHSKDKGIIVEGSEPFGDGFINIAEVELDALNNIIYIEDKREFLCDTDTLKQLIEDKPNTTPVAGSVVELEAEVLKLTLSVRDLVFQNNLGDFFIKNPSYSDKVLRNFLDNSNIDLVNSTGITYNSVDQSIEFNRPSPGRVVYYNPDTEKIEDRRVVSGDIVWDLDVSATATDPDLNLSNTTEIKVHQMIDGRYLLAVDVASGSNPTAKVMIVNNTTKVVDFKHQPTGVSGATTQIVSDAIEEISYTGADPNTATATGNIIIAGGEKDSSIYAIRIADGVEQWRIGTKSHFTANPWTPANNSTYFPRSVDNCLDNNVLVLDQAALKVYDKTTGNIVRLQGTPSSGCNPTNAVGQFSFDAVEMKTTTDTVLLAGTEHPILNSNAFRGAMFLDGQADGVYSGFNKFGKLAYAIGAQAFTTVSSTSDVYGRLNMIESVDEANDGHFVARLRKAEATGTGPTATITNAGLVYVDIAAENRVWNLDFIPSGSNATPSAVQWTHNFQNIDWIEDALTALSTAICQDNVFTASGNVASVVFDANTFLTGDSTITFEMSNDNGTTWETVTPGTEHTFTSVGNQLIVKATINKGTVTVPTDFPKIYDWGYIYKLAV